VNTNNLNDQENVSFIGKIKESFSGRKFRSGAYVTVVSTIVIVMVLLVNMLISSMNIEFDLSSQKMYSITQETKDYVAGIKDDITIYYIAQTNSELETFTKVIKKYDSMSKHIKVEYKDPVLYPTFTSQYTEEQVQENSVIVVNNTNGKSKYIPYRDMIVQEMDYNTYQSTTTGIDIEGEITSALQYVTSESAGKIYVTEGHGEAQVGSEFEERIQKMNIAVETLKTVASESIPEDCDILFINCPTSDFTEDEVKQIKDYLTNGGNVVATVNFRTNKLPNYISILEYYGIQVVDGMVIETNRNMYSTNNPTYVLPKVEYSDITKKATTAEIPVFLPMSSGLTTLDTTRSSLTFTSLLTTSEDSYSKTNLNAKTLEKEENDVDGPFALGLLAKDSYNGVESNLLVYGTDLTFDDSLLAYGNSELLNGTVSYFIGNTSTLSIPTKSLAYARINVSSREAILWAGVVVILVPLATLVTGIVVCLLRRKK
jgi:ABC-2 type transport system permease protein